MTDDFIEGYIMGVCMLALIECIIFFWMFRRKLKECRQKK